MAATDTSLLGRLRRTRTVFGTDAHTAANGVHTFDVARAPDEDGYFGYAGPVLGGAIDLWWSPNLDEWKHVAADILPIRDARWATVVSGSDTLWLIVREKTSRIPFLGGQQLTLFESHDGRSFSRVGPSVARSTHDGMVANPFLFDDDDGIGLIYYEGGDDECRIWVRTATDPVRLADGTDRLLAAWTGRLLAAPSMYRRKSGEYVFLAESIHAETDDWTTVGTAVPNLDAQVVPDETTLLFADDEACPFPFVQSDTLYLFTSRCIEPHPPGEVDAAWEGVIREYDQ